MTHEFLHIIRRVHERQQAGVNSVLATVVALDGSSYRQPGVRMLVHDNGETYGAVSGGCVEKEVIQAAQGVLASGIPTVITYDGRFRLGCEGTLFMLLEPIEVTAELHEMLEQTVRNRVAFSVETTFEPRHGATGSFGSNVCFQDRRIPLSTEVKAGPGTFTQHCPPLLKLLVIGGEHDTAGLVQIGKSLGWQTEVVTSLNNRINHFPATDKLHRTDADNFDLALIDEHTAVVLMTHSYSTDLKYLMRLTNAEPMYIGILGAIRRRERLMDELLNYHPQLELAWLEKVYAPAGLNVGAITPEEIGLSISAEILSVIREKGETSSLREIPGEIHRDLQL